MKGKKGLSAAQVAAICKQENITLTEYYRRNLEDTFSQEEKNFKEKENEEEMQKSLEKTVISGPSHPVLSASKQNRFSKESTNY